MPSEKNVLPMTADDVTHLFRSTEKCRPQTRGNRLNILAYEVLHEALRNFTTTSPSPDPSSSAEPLLPSLLEEHSNLPIRYTLEELKIRYAEMTAVWKRGTLNIDAIEMLNAYANPGVAISETDVPSILQCIHEVECLCAEKNTDTKCFYPTKVSKIFVRGFLCGRGYDEYFL